MTFLFGGVVKGASIREILVWTNSELALVQVEIVEEREFCRVAV